MIEPAANLTGAGSVSVQNCPPTIHARIRPHGENAMTLKPIASLAFALALAGTAPAFAANPAAVDLLGIIFTGVGDGATIGLYGGDAQAVVSHPDAGVWWVEPSGAQSIGFYVVEKSHCVFDITLLQSCTNIGGLEVDANKLTGIDFNVVDTKDKFTDYSAVIHGADGVLQNMTPQGELSPYTATNNFSTSMNKSDLEKALKQFQTLYCKAA